MKLIWKPNFSSSAIHAAYAVALGRALIDEKVEAAVVEQARSIQAFCDDICEGGSRRLWLDLIGFASEIDSNRELSERALNRNLGVDAVKPNWIMALSNWITDLEATFRLLFPQLQAQLELRSRPLREIWDGYGNGLLAHVGRLTEKNLLVEQADVILIQPVLGGAGEAHLAMNRVHIEAVLSNPVPELPEVLRLIWLLAQLQMDAPIYSEGVHGHRLAEVAGLSMLPAVLAAGQVVELAKIDEPTIELAIQYWRVPIPRRTDVVQILLAWWETYLQTRPSWNIALTALDRMLLPQA